MSNFDTERFIIEIQSRTSLWDSSAIEYANRDLKQRNWEELVKIFGGGDLATAEKNALGQELQQRWKNLRGCYFREVKRKKQVESGPGAGSRKSECVYCKQLQLLQEVVTIRDASRNEEAQTQDIQNNVEKRSRKRKRFQNETDTFVEVLNRSIEKKGQREKSEDEEDTMFLLSLLTSLKSVPTEKKMTLKINMMSLINEAMQENIS
ncbi:hypothetical protein B7P43_G09752 [Cryptotermes secundus]|uniref:MADF domain-containing protein n=1 Tax=Cryptotermes secundus TaxID=105785 RepID=A0A2J7RSI4_9NEOP|nr:hypothetical protein B7P43_G09752 [Cryptotermes secundus]